MRLFVFAIGGTGARVLTSMIMQFAAGVRPKDAGGKYIEELSVVPIIVDPHESNAGLLNVISLLNDYRVIRERIYGKNPKAEGFFSVKLETLSEISTQNNEVSTDQFFFSMPRVSDNQFKTYINLNDMDLENRLLMKVLFSPEELDTYMREGFYGSPNIGCVALNEFRRSSDFDAFRSAFNRDSGDRIFFVGSIFGGTGAAGLPLFVSAIRDLTHVDNLDAGRTDCSEAPIGALIVMPYFAIEADPTSSIDENQFIIKTKSALRYYQDNLNKYLNVIYYIADTDRTKAFENDPGNKDNQKGNKAHIVENIGATAILDFMAMSDDALSTREDNMGRCISVNTSFKQYSFENEVSDISFRAIPSSTNDMLMRPFMKFLLLESWMKHHLMDRLGAPFARNYKPIIESSILTRELDSFFIKFNEWIEEQRGHGSTAHNLAIFTENPMAYTKEYTKVFNEILTKKGIVGRKSIDKSDIEKSLNDVAQKHDKLKTQHERWFTIANEALDKIIDDKLDISNLVSDKR